MQSHLLPKAQRYMVHTCKRNVTRQHDTIFMKINTLINSTIGVVRRGIYGVDDINRMRILNNGASSLRRFSRWIE